MEVFSGDFFPLIVGGLEFCLYFCRDKRTKEMQNARLIGLCSVQHFLVDGLCVCCLFLLARAYGDCLAAYGDRLGMEAVLMYSVLAFVSQPLTGMMADGMKARHRLLVVSSLLLTLAVAVASLIALLMTEALKVMEGAMGEWLLMLVAVLLGAGNSLFHVWGGKQTVVCMGNDMRALGVFVSTGALGLSVGFVCCSWVLLYALLLAVVALAIVYLRSEECGVWSEECGMWSEECGVRSEECGVRSEVAPRSLSPLSAWTAVVLLMLFVAYRSFTGEVFSRGITKSQTLILVIGAVSMLGKMAGGWIAHRVGILLSMAVVLAGVGLCLLFRGDSVAVLLMGIFLMNCTMPVTLFLANDVLPGREGLAFGLLAAALIPGYLLAVYL